VFKWAGPHHGSVAVFSCQQDDVSVDALLVSPHFMAEVDGESLRTQSPEKQ